MREVMVQQAYLDELNAVNKKYGMCIKYDPNFGSYIIDDLIDNDSRQVDLNFDRLNSEHKFVLGQSYDVDKR